MKTTFLSFLFRLATPVSYTHLDVYKRQASQRLCPLAVAALWNAKRFLFGTCSFRRRTAYQQSSLWRFPGTVYEDFLFWTGTIPVSYTHLDIQNTNVDLKINPLKKVRFYQKILTVLGAVIAFILGACIPIAILGFTVLERGEIAAYQIERVKGLWYVLTSWSCASGIVVCVIYFLLILLIKKIIKKKGK